jgi:WD40 repeat protein
VHDVALAPDGSWVLTGGADGTARLWDPGRRGAKVVLEGHEGAVTQVAVSSDSALGLTGGTDDRIMVWELTAAHPELDAVRFDLHEDDVTALITYGADGERAADARRMAFSASSDNAVRTWNLERKDEEQDSVRLAGHAGTVGAIAVSHDANWLLSGSTDHTARVWDHAATRPGGASKVARGHTGPVLSVAVTAAGRIVTGSADGTARLWDPSGGRVETVAVLAGHQGRVKSVAVSPDGSLAATGGEDGIVRLWDLLRPDLGAAPQLLQGHRGEINHVEFGPAGTGGPVVVSIGADRTARVWTPGGASGRVHVLQHPDEVNAMALDPQGRWLLTGSISRVTLWDLRAADPAKAARAFPGHEVDVLTVAIDPHARWAASSSADPLVMLWNLEAGGEGTRLRRHQEPVDALAFSPDGTRLATGSRDQTIRLWDLSSPDPDRDSITLTGHAQRIGTLAFTPDGQWLLSASYDGIVRAWDIRNTDEQAIIDSALDLAGHGQLISDLAVASDGRFVVTASYDDSARLWPLDPRDLIGLGCAKVGRSLTEGEWKQDFTGPYRAGCK